MEDMKLETAGDKFSVKAGNNGKQLACPKSLKITSDTWSPEFLTRLLIVGIILSTVNNKECFICEPFLVRQQEVTTPGQDGTPA